MPEIMAGINTYLHSKIQAIPADVPEDNFPGDSNEELMCRHDVSPLIRQRYLDGSYWAEFSFSYYRKSMNVITARQALEAIMGVLQIDNFTALFGLTDGRLETVTRPSFVSKDESGVNIYTSSYRLVYFQEA